MVASTGERAEHLTIVVKGDMSPISLRNAVEVTFLIEISVSECGNIFLLVGQLIVKYRHDAHFTYIRTILLFMRDETIHLNNNNEYLKVYRECDRRGTSQGF